MRARFVSIFANLMRASIGLILVVCVVLGRSEAAWALSSPGLSSSSAPAISLAETTIELSQTSPSPDLEPTDLETTLDQFLQGIPRGYYGLQDINQLKTRLKETNLVLIDVRETPEFIAGHIHGAINLPLRTLVQNLEQVPKDKPVMLYCSSGYRTGMGVMTLRLLGYDNVEGFPPSYNGWLGAQ